MIQNPKTGKQERRIIRRPYNNEDVEIGDDLDEVQGNKTVVARKIV